MSANATLELVLFATAPAQVRQALAAGVSSFIADWECRGKEERQRGADTEINSDTPADLESLTRCGAPRRYCRLNAFGRWTAEEVEMALAAGATHLFLPMVRQCEEVAAVRRIVAGRCHLGILIETQEALDGLEALARQPVEFVYIGLNDLALSRGSRSIFDAFSDGVVDSVRAAFAGVRFGCAGVTAVDAGSPMPCRLLLGELMRLGCDFTFARRSFRRDMASRDLKHEVTLIQQVWQRLLARSAAEIARDKEAFDRAIRAARDHFSLDTANLAASA